MTQPSEARPPALMPADRIGLATRRRSPAWVRAMDGPTLHALGTRLIRDFGDDGLSAQQDWLLSAVLSELEYRRRRALRARRSLSACHCWLCLPMDAWSVDPSI